MQCLLEGNDKKRKKFVWSDSCQQSFENTIEALCNAPGLRIASVEGAYVVETDLLKHSDEAGTGTNGTLLFSLSARQKGNFPHSPNNTLRLLVLHEGHDAVMQMSQDQHSTDTHPGEPENRRSRGPKNAPEKSFRAKKKKRRFWLPPPKTCRTVHCKRHVTFWSGGK